MLFNYRYRGQTSVSNSSRATGMSFVPDAYRDPTYFVGKLNQRVPFREAISALHDVVISDLRFKPRDKTAYREWASQQEDIWMAEAMAEAEDVRDRVTEVRSELHAINVDVEQVMSPFYKAQRKYFQFLWKKDKAAWFVLDPVITVHPDEVFFECFSEDESSYGRLGCNYEVFTEISECACGTTNIDYSASLYDEFQKIRDYKETSFSIDPRGFEIQTDEDDAYNEVKIDLPDSWVRGFLQVSSAMTIPGGAKFNLHPMDVHNFCFVLRRFREKHGPRSIRFRLKPGQPISVIFEPWNVELHCPRSIYHGFEEREIRIWGRRRLLILERLIPIARSFAVTLLGDGMPSFFVADLGDLHFTLGLSGWTANDWSRMGNFDLMAPRKEMDVHLKKSVFDALKEKWVEKPADLAQRLGISEDIVGSALASYVQAGRAIYDLHAQAYRVRELSRDPLPMAALRFANEREEEANALLRSGSIHVAGSQRDGMLVIAGKVTDTRKKKFKVQVRVDADARLVHGECNCNFYTQNKLRLGPCAHMLAARMKQNEKAFLWT
ncbi:MAG: SWIM zinc finger family protein [Verrucomicrobiae bacterium]|nr:SWIM zinc finger family protein [Verrucomicrobiae bacterium]